LVGVTSDEGDGDQWPQVRERIVEDGAHHVISEIRGPGPGEDYLDDDSGHDWSRTTGIAAASNLLAAARALSERPIPPPPG
jgi:hypothetical protein